MAVLAIFSFELLYKRIAEYFAVITRFLLLLYLKNHNIMSSTFDHNIVNQVIGDFNLPEFGKATIREIVAIANTIENKTGKRFVHMEMGVPGLKAQKIGVDAEIEALRNGVASKYPMMSGLPVLKKQATRFIKAFIDVDIDEDSCIPVVGSMQGTFASILVAGQCDKKKDTILFIDPGFPVQKLQTTVLGYKCEAFDAYEFRGKALVDKIESFLKKENVAAIVYSNPNNPSWICLNEEELNGIGKLATKYDTIILEDLAYFAMDFRKELEHPFKAPFQSTIAKYTDNYIMLISSSKAFSYAGQRIGIIAMSNKIRQREYPTLKERYGVGEFGNVLVNRVLYAVSAGTTHSTQYAMAAMLKAAADGSLNFVKQVSIYGERAKKAKRIFINNGFHIVYDKDVDKPVGDGFYFTVGYKNMSGAKLMERLIYYGISAISLDTTGSHEQGLRICTSFIQDDQYDDLAERLKSFATDYPLKG